MSFDISCTNCGAPSSISVGTCPYCKSTFKNKKTLKSENPLISNIRKEYKEGAVDNALFSSMVLYKNNEKIKENNSFIILYLNLLIETDGPPTLMRSLISRALLNDSNCTEALDFLEILEAREELSTEKNDPGERRLKSLIQRSPNNPYSYFYLGAHLFWIDKDYSQAIIYLEKTVQLRPTYVRAWGCLGALYKELDNETLSKRAFMNAAKLEKNVSMKKFFKQQMNN